MMTNDEKDRRKRKRSNWIIHYPFFLLLSITIIIVAILFSLLNVGFRRNQVVQEGALEYGTSVAKEERNDVVIRKLSLGNDTAK
jgi:hypothetical protein